ncbi:MAG TPA: efflux RND transporter periplasmic adaptor subunit, partial [Anaeromyxobacter sp.]|nr:efflux RND transporter periplasmic adaptor subunit [Anaeromyxobacter sp.]
QPGERVRKGSPLVTILSPDVGVAFSDLVKAHADLLAGEAEFDRQRRLAAAQAASQRELEAAEDAYLRAEAEYSRASEKAKLLRAGAVNAVTQEYTLQSYLDGSVISRSVSPGMEVQGQYSGGQPAEMFTIGDIRRVWVVADVPDAALPDVKPGAEVSVRVVAYPDRVFRGKVEQISGTLDPQLRTAKVRAALDNEDEALKPEMYAQVAVAKPPRRALALPRAAVVPVAGQSFVYVAAGAAPGGKRAFQRRLVRLGEAVDDLVEVVEGVAPGEDVIVEGPPSREAPPDQAYLSEEQVRRAGIRVAAAEEEDLPDAISLAGRLAFDDLRVTHVFSPVTGRVTRVLARPGQRVKKGAPLAAILSPDVGSAAADLTKAEADLTQAYHQHQRQQELYEAHAGARRDLEAAENAWKKAKAEADRARQKMQLLHAGTVDRASQELVLTSPIDGEIVARNLNPGMEVQGQYSGAQSAVELFTIGDTRRLWVLAEAYEVDLPRVREGDPVEVQIGAVPGRPFRGTIDWVSDVLDPQLRTAKVRCAIDNREGLLRPEMYEAVTVRVPGRKVIAVPRPAVLRVGDDRIVFVRKGATADGRIAFERRTVSADEGRADGKVAVWSGLRAGDPVVVDGAILVLGAM